MSPNQLGNDLVALDTWSSSSGPTRGAIHAERWGNGDTQSGEGIGPYETYRAVALHNLRAALEAGHFDVDGPRA
jgi:hypothetical protein